jgi:D-glycerate 3-kinase
LTGAGDGNSGSGIEEEALRAVRWAGEAASPALLACLATLDRGQPADLRGLAAALAQAWRAKRLRRVGLSGGQGAGKSTLARLLETACAQLGLRVCALSLDDYYLPRAERLALALRVHPLFETRGPPGTHDVALCRAHVRALGEPGELEIPVFDKGRDDRVGTRRVSGPFDLVVLEGWCVGASPLGVGSLAVPVNALERDEDPEGIWRRYQDAELARGYAALWAELEALAFLRVPDLACVRRWRLAQESERSVDRRLDAAAIDRFVAHYERITLELMARLPERAEWTIDLAPDHSIASIVRRDRGAA